MAYAYVKPAVELTDLEDLFMPDDSSPPRDGGGLSASQRFDRLEQTVIDGFRSVNSRLDTFATRIDLEQLRGSTTAGLEAQRSRIENLERNGSWHVQDLLKERDETRRRLDVLEKGQTGSDSVNEALQTYRRWLVGIALTVGGLVLIVANNFFTIRGKL